MRGISLLESEVAISGALLARMGGPEGQVKLYFIISGCCETL